MADVAEAVAAEAVAEAVAAEDVAEAVAAEAASWPLPRRKGHLRQARGAYEPSIARVFVETSVHALRLYMRGGRLWTCVAAQIEMRL